jgi:lipopolysaccharide/colanic/teichoic acid biosynthesis glycosyltransferase
MSYLAGRAPHAAARTLPPRRRLPEAAPRPPLKRVIEAAWAALLLVYRPVLKRAIDGVGAALLLLLVAPAFVLVFMLLLLAGGGGPAFVARPRVGRGGRGFGLLAFRVPGAEDEERPSPTRLGRALGRALRGTGMDEIPQLLNVLRGDTSLVGPRPASREELGRRHAWFGGEAAATAYITVRPGLVGPGQVHGGDLSAREQAALEVAYARRPSLRADLAILARALGQALGLVPCGAAVE